jgi:hypothetical protein
MRLSRLKQARNGKPKSLGREIAVLLAIKAAVLYGLWLAFFSHPAIHSMIEGMDPGRVADALVTSSISAPPTPAPPASAPPTPTQDSAS